MVEILRRVVLVLGVYGAIVALFYARPVVVEIEVEDFAASQASRPAWSSAHRKSLDVFIQDRTEGRRLEAGGAEWETLYRALERARKGESLEGRFRGRAGVGLSKGSLYLLPDESPVASLDPPLTEGRAFVYARLQRPDGVVWLCLIRRIGREAQWAPASLVRPLQGWWWLFLLGGVALYIALPHRRRREQTLTYSTAQAYVLPDVVGLLLGGTFFTVGLLAGLEMTTSGVLFDPAAWPLYVFMGVFVAFAWVIHGWGSWYDAFRLDVGPEDIHLRTLWQDRRVAYANITEARLEARRAPKLLRRLMWGAALLNTGAAGQAMLLSARADAELVLIEGGGRRTRLRLTALEGSERVFDALEAAGVTIEDGTDSGA